MFYLYEGRWDRCASGEECCKELLEEGGICGVVGVCVGMEVSRGYLSLWYM
jgi:aspartate/methionine/tyrosine aminotransferase